MTPLRAKYIRDLTVRGRAQRTQRAYNRYVSELARYYQRSPELISYEEVTNWLYHLIKERRLSAKPECARRKSARCWVAASQKARKSTQSKVSLGMIGINVSKIVHLDASGAPR